jgi:hypothetical protein
LIFDFPIFYGGGSTFKIPISIQVDVYHFAVHRLPGRCRLHASV